LFGELYRRLQNTHAVPGKRFRFKGKLFSLDGSLIDLSMKVFPWADVAPKKAAFNSNGTDLSKESMLKWP